MMGLINGYTKLNYHLRKIGSREYRNYSPLDLGMCQSMRGQREKPRQDDNRSQ